MAVRMIGELLIKKGVINKEQLDQALKESPDTEEMLGMVLINKGYLKEAQLFEALSEQFNLPFYPHLKELKITPLVIKAVPVKLVKHFGFMPIKLEKKVLTVAVSNPMDVWLAEDIKLNLGYHVQRILSTRAEIDQAISKYYGAVAGTVDKIISDKREDKSILSPKEERIEDIEKSAEEASVIKLVNQILSEAIKMRATDIHIELYQNKVHLRYRIDGVLREMKVPEDISYIQPAIVSRVKIMSHLDVVEHRLPQDGRAKVRLQGGEEVDLRISIIPAYFGENIVIRILPTKVLLDLDKIGLDPDSLQKLEKLIQKPHGIIMITGPTGSGKTTTLYAALSRLNKPQVKIISIEDPVEYALEGITQIHVNPKVGLTFASALRSVLRHDPDIMMVGEIRDPETADLAIRSALTGHLVFSTLHTNDAPSAIARLLDMGIEPFLLASSVDVLIAQRLVRLLCLQCKGKGCDNCTDTGFRGRRPIFEVLIVDDAIREMIINRRSSREIKEKAKKQGMRSLKDTGMQLVKEGLTSQEEIMRVVEIEE
ncbi:MAG: ATPase, T2SS/T4P/T4SS family [Candidatus Omnitrophota bacterium]